MKAKKAVDFMAGLRAVEEREGVQRRPRPAPAPKQTRPTSQPQDACFRGPLPAAQPPRQGRHHPLGRPGRPQAGGPARASTTTKPRPSSSPRRSTCFLKSTANPRSRRHDHDPAPLL